MCPKCGMFDPVRERRLTESHAIPGKERVLAKLQAAVARLWVCENLARIKREGCSKWEPACLLRFARDNFPLPEITD